MSNADKQKLHQLVNAPNGTVIAMNHSADLDVLAVLEIARQAKYTPVVMGTVELFQSNFAGLPVGKLIPKIGGMSVDRAAKNKDATLEGGKQVVRENKYPLLLCPEGYVTHANRTVYPLKNGASHVALDNALKHGQNVNVVPLSLYYHYDKDLSKDIEKRIETLEKAVQGQASLTQQPATTIPERIENLFERLVREREKTYGVTRDTNTSPYERLDTVREHVVDRLELRHLNREFDGKGGQEIRARRVAGHLRRTMRDLKQADKKDPRLQELKADLAELDDVIDLSMYQEGYPLDNQDAQMQVLLKLRRDITRDNSWLKENPMFLPRYPVKIMVKVGDPIPAANYAQAVNMGTPQRSAENLYSKAIQTALQAGIDASVAELSR